MPDIHGVQNFAKAPLFTLEIPSTSRQSKNLSKKEGEKMKKKNTKSNEFAHKNFPHVEDRVTSDSERYFLSPGFSVMI